MGSRWDRDGIGMGWRGMGMGWRGITRHGMGDGLVSKARTHLFPILPHPIPSRPALPPRPPHASHAPHSPPNTARSHPNPHAGEATPRSRQQTLSGKRDARECLPDPCHLEWTSCRCWPVQGRGGGCSCHWWCSCHWVRRQRADPMAGAADPMALRAFEGQPRSDPPKSPGSPGSELTRIK